MRISDWSSDVCSSDLTSPCPTVRRAGSPSSSPSASRHERLAPDPRPGPTVRTKPPHPQHRRIPEMTRFRIFRVVGLALSLSLVAAACGDDDDTSTDASAESEGTSTESESTESETMSEDMGEESAAPASSAEACDADAIVAAVEEGSNEEGTLRSEEHTSELQSLMRISYAVFCLKK